MEQVFVDTGFWYAFANEKDVNHARALRLLDEPRRLVTTNYILDETITLTLIRSGYRQAVTLGEVLWQAQLADIVRVTEEDERRAWALFKQYDDKRFSFTDCTSFAVMLRLGITVALSFDDDFSQTGLFVQAL
jgi:predicted nucleic acid-binding protein